MSGRMKKQAVCLQMLIKTKNAKLRKAILEHADSELIRALCECAHNILRGNVHRWILTGVASSIGGLCRHTVATSTVCVTKGTGDDEGTRGLTKGTGGISLLIGDQRGPEGLTKGTRGPGERRRGPEGSRY